MTKTKSFRQQFEIVTVATTENYDDIAASDDDNAATAEALKMTMLLMLLMKVINAIILPIANNWPSVKRSIDNDNLKRPGRYCPDGSQ